jgi:hypothetical protein
MQVGLYLHAAGDKLDLVLSVQSLRIPLGFLLIVRTGRIFTARLSPNEYRRILGFSSI